MYLGKNVMKTGAQLNCFKAERPGLITALFSSFCATNNISVAETWIYFPLYFYSLSTLSL